MRNSVASHQTYPSYPSSEHASEYAADSVYNLNTGPGRSSTYRDDPGFFNADQPLRRNMSEKRAAYGAPKSRRKKRILIGLAALVLLLIVIAAVLYFAVFKKKSSDSSSTKSGSASDNTSSSSSNSSSTPQGKVAIVTGKDGSSITAEDGSTFTYTNSFGGTWYWDVNDPYNNGARAQSWTPALNETFNIGQDKIRGCVLAKAYYTISILTVRSVNIGGWLVTEPVRSVPAPVFSKLIFAYSLLHLDSTSPSRHRLRAVSPSSTSTPCCRPVARLPSRITTRPLSPSKILFRIPIGYWAIEVLDGEEFLPNTSWQYLLKAVQ